jgi:DnaJ-class molecular chaperone
MSDQQPQPQTCTSCAGSGTRMVTVNRVAADGHQHQGLVMETCTSCGGSGQRAA